MMRLFIFEDRRSFVTFLGALIFVGAILCFIAPYFLAPAPYSVGATYNDWKNKASQKLNKAFGRMDQFNDAASNAANKVRNR